MHFASFLDKLNGTIHVNHPHQTKNTTIIYLHTRLGLLLQNCITHTSKWFDMRRIHQIWLSAITLFSQTCWLDEDILQIMMRSKLRKRFILQNWTNEVILRVLKSSKCLVYAQNLVFFLLGWELFELLSYVFVYFVKYFLMSILFGTDTYLVSI